MTFKRLVDLYCKYKTKQRQYTKPNTHDLGKLVCFFKTICVVKICSF